MSQLFSPTKGFIFGSFLFDSIHFSQEKCCDIWNERYAISEHFFPLYNPLEDYYSKEMGQNLKRFFVIDFKLQEREDFVPAKLWADSIERKFMNNSNRIVNLDIGFLSLENFQLATGKPYSHRVYLGSGVYSDLTYIFEGKSYVSLKWTYPDYRDEKKIEQFNKWRAQLKASL